MDDRAAVKWLYDEMCIRDRIMIVVGIVAVVVWIISMWRRGGQYTGKLRRWLAVIGIGVSFGAYPVSYTHLDVYKRQRPDLAETISLSASREQ